MPAKVSAPLKFNACRLWRPSVHRAKKSPPSKKLFDKRSFWPKTKELFRKTHDISFFSGLLILKAIFATSKQKQNYSKHRSESQKVFLQKKTFQSEAFHCYEDNFWMYRPWSSLSAIVSLFLSCSLPHQQTTKWTNFQFFGARLANLMHIKRTIQ